MNYNMKKEPLPVKVDKLQKFTQEPADSSDEYIDEPDEEEEEEEEEAIPEEIEEVDEKVINDDVEITEQTPSIQDMPPAIQEEQRAIQRLASQVVANEEPEKNLALIKNTLSYLPMPLFPYVADSVANTLMDAKDENGKPIFESKNEIIKLLKDLRNSKLRKTSKSGRSVGKKAGKGKRKHERDYIDYMLTKRINPAVLITPRMK